MRTVDNAVNSPVHRAMDSSAGETAFVRERYAKAGR